MIVTCDLQGGLGNQMFEIATTFSLTRRLRIKDPILFDKVICSFDFNECYTPFQGNSSHIYQDGIFSNIIISDLSKVHFTHCWYELGFKYKEIPLVTTAENYKLRGYFQSPKYFDDYKDEIKGLFYFSFDDRLVIRQLLHQISPDKKITAVHVRRGDYLTKTDFHSVCAKEYYDKAMEMMMSNYSSGCNFIFISDDIEWCKENFKGDNIYYSPFTNEVDDITLMLMCDNHIIANSSFSWWGAYLCNWIDQKVIAPKQWFGPAGPQDTQDLYPENWIKL